MRYARVLQSRTGFFGSKCLRFEGMQSKQGTTDKSVVRSASTVLLDFVFGEPLPQPEVTERNDEQGWLAWLAAKKHQDTVVDFEDTRPMA